MGGSIAEISFVCDTPEDAVREHPTALRDFSIEFRVKKKPDRERVLRCTSAIDAKQKKFAEYRTKGIVGTSDCLVIAVNICRLSDLDFDGNGISQLPLVMEAVFPIGPLGVPITQGGELDGPAHQRHMIGNDLVLSMVYNPLARKPLPTGLFSVDKELVAEEKDDKYIIKGAAIKP
jgi:hypothetical protein